MRQDSEALNLEQVLAVLRRRFPLIAVCVIVVAGGAFVFSKHKTKEYTAAASISFTNDTVGQQIAGLSTNSQPNSSSALVAQEASNVEAAKSREAAVQTAGLLGIAPATVLGSLTIAGQGESPIVLVSATTPSPVLSARIANTYTQQVVSTQQRNNAQYLQSALAIVRKQLKSLTPEQQVGPDGLQLQNRVQTLSLLSQLKIGNSVVGAVAVPPSSPSSPRTSRNTALGALIGLMIGLVLTLVLERLDRGISGSEELEAIYRAPLLGSIPLSSALAHSGRKRHTLPAAEAEEFSLIRARLRFFNIDRDLRTIVIASAEPGDGKTLVSRHLAEAAARLGSRVLLVEVDLRHPTLAQQVGLPPGTGLADVLIGSTQIGDATHAVDVVAASGEDDRPRTMDVLVAGSVLPPNPGELLESEAMAGVLSRARFEYDLVVIDTPPLTAVSDAFALLTTVDGIVIVGRIGRTQRHAAQRLHQVLSSSGAPVLGIVANGARSGELGAYAYTRDGAGTAAQASSNGASSSGELSPTATT